MSSLKKVLKENEIKDLPCYDCMYFYGWQSKGGILSAEGKIVAIDEPFVSCGNIRYYKLESEAKKCKDKKIKVQ